MAKTKPKAKYEDTPTGWAKRWVDEFAAAKKDYDKTCKDGDKVNKIFLGSKRVDDDRSDTDSQLNLFHANVTLMLAMLYGNLPKAEVDRTYADPNDAMARVSAEMLERILNQDIQNAGDDYATILRTALSDRLIPGLGNARVRYDYKSEFVHTPAITHEETGEELAPAVDEEHITDQWVDTIYTYWKDMMWSPARTHAEIRWKAYRSYMTKDELTKRFGPDSIAMYDNAIDKIPLNSKGPMSTTDNGADENKPIMPQAEVWEIWYLDNRSVYWYVKDYDRILDCQEDPLELDQFFPEPPPMIANITSSKFTPKADYKMSQDLYNAIDDLEERLSYLIAGCKLVGVYDESQDDIKRLMNEGIENQLIPVKNWARFAEQNGLEGLVQWMPIETVANVIEKLRAEQQVKVQQLYEVTGMADVIRGASQQAYTSAAETKTKSQFASIRIQALQDEFARWASDLQCLKAEVISKHYNVASIIKQSNILYTEDADVGPAAAAFITNPDSGLKWRVTVRPESLALADYAQMKQDRTEFMMAVSQFVQSMGSLIQMDPGFTPFLLQIMQWGMSGFKGSQQIEGVMDKAIKQFQQQAAETAGKPKPNPEMDKAKMQMQLMQAESQQKMQESAQEHQQKLQADQQKQQLEFSRASADHQAYMQKVQNDMALENQKFENQMELLKAQLVVELATLSAKQKAQDSTTATDMLQHAEQTRLQAAADTATITHGAVTDMAVDKAKADNAKDVTDHTTAKQKEAATHAAKISSESSDSGDGTGK